MRTFILEWNPAISSYRMEDFEREIGEIMGDDFNWSVWEWDRARDGDNFYLIKCGEGTTGVVMKGFFCSAPYQAEDWSGKKRVTYYMDMYPTHMIHPNHPKGLLTTQMLDERMPDFRWNGGHSGRELPQDKAAILNKMWDVYISRFTDEDVDHETYAKVYTRPAEIEDAITIATNAHRGDEDLDGKPVILHPLAVGLMGKTEKEMICGFLHDVLEDTDWEVSDLRDQGFSEDIVDTLLLLRHDKSIPYLDYVKTIVESGDETAIAVKLNDLHHNLERGKAGGHTKQVQKHTQALEFISEQLKK